MSHILFLHLYSLNSPGVTPEDSFMSLSTQCLEASGMNSVESGANILPSDTYQNISFEIVYTYGNMSKFIEIVH